MNEIQLRTKASALISTLKDRKVISAFQTMLDNTTDVEQILMLIDFVELYQTSEIEPEIFFRRVVFLGQTNVSLSDTLLFTVIVNDVARLFFKSKKSRKVVLKTDDDNQQILKAHRENSLRNF
ncbi:hypothetical protein [Pseudomonas nabeulensis]|uniref:hypothetical protein n=1 Tax=Pseudomonas nabeulensis TaxID=2293833 RepID=UPI001075D805|nr:hypothetical protein [Pseudomonas nabeulensis]